MSGYPPPFSGDFATDFIAMCFLALVLFCLALVWAEMWVDR